MLSFYCVAAIFINFALSDMNSVNLLNNTDNTKGQPTIVTPAFSSSTENYLNSFTSENLLTTSSSSKNTEPKEVDDFISLTLENFPTTSVNLVETTTNVNNFKDIETTPSWELIYPENTSTTPEPSSSISHPALSPHIATESFEGTFPKYFKVDDVTNCKKFFGQCLGQVLAKVVPKLKDGHKSLNLPSLDPIYFNATTFQYNSGPFSGFIAIRYALTYGFTTMQFKKIYFYKKADKFKARLTILVPKMTVVGSYKGDIHVNNIRARPKGDFNVSMTGLGIDLLSLGVIYRKDDHTFLKFTKSNATTTLRDSKINASGIFPDQRLNEIVLNVANQYWRDLFNIVLPETRNNWLPILLNALNAALGMVPFDFFEITS